MAKKKIVTTEEIDSGENGREPVEAEVINPEVSELLSYIESISDNANVVKIFKVIEGQKWYCGRCEPGTINEDNILKKWGGGQYYLVALNNGQFIPGGSKNIKLFQAVEDPFKTDGGRQAGSAEGDTQFRFIMEQMQRQHEMVLKMIEAMRPHDQGLNPADIMSMVRDMAAMAPKGPDVGAILPTITTLFTKTMELAKDGADGGDKLSWQGIAKYALQQLPGMLQTVALARAGQPVPNPPGGEAMPVEQMVAYQGLQWLKKRAKAGKSVENITDMLLDNIDDDTFGPVAMAILNSPFAEIEKIDPEIAKEPLHSWFFALYNDLKGAVGNANSSAVAGPGGSDPDTAADEGNGSGSDPKPGSARNSGKADKK